MYYAQITNGVVTAVSELAGEVDAPNMIQIDGLDPTLLGKAYEAGEFVDVAPPVVVDPCEWLVDTGPWKDRFDTFGYPGLRGIVLALGRTNDTCYAANADLVGRKYVDLKNRRAELLAVLASIAAVVVAAGFPEFTLAMRTAMVDTPAEPEENAALRKDYFA